MRWATRKHFVLSILLLELSGVAVPGQDKRSHPLALTGLTVIDATGRAPQTDMTIVISGDRIVSIAKSGTAKLSAETVIEDFSGKFAIPGLWDMHVHLTDVTDTSAPLFVANGVTGVRDMGGDLVYIDWMRRNIEAGRLVGPRIVRAGPFVDGLKPGLHNRLVVSDAETGRDAVDFLKRSGVDFIKVHTGVPRDAYFALMTQAKDKGMVVVGHVPGGVSALEAAIAGQKSIEHITSIGDGKGGLNDLMRGGMSGQQAMDEYDRQTPELFRTFVSKGTAVDPTLVVSHPAERTAELDPRGIYISASVKRQWASMCPPASGTPDARALEFYATRVTFFEKYLLKWVREMNHAGVLLLAGTDLGVCGVYPGFSLHDELDWLVKAGLSPMDALQAATRNAALFLGKSDMGTLEKGKSADLVVLDANPLDNIANTRAIRAVVLRGQILHRDILDKLLADTATTASKH